MSATGNGTSQTVDALERDLLARLGLPPASSSEDIDAAHRAVTAYLAHAPRELKTWARGQAAAADEAYALLIDPAALADSVALVGPTARPAVMPGGPATPPARRDPSATKSASNGAGSVAKDGSGTKTGGAAKTGVTTKAADQDAPAREPTFEELLAEVTPTTHRDAAPQSNVLTGDAVRPAPAAGGAGASSGRRRLGLAGFAVVGALAIAFAGYQLGSAGGTTGTTPAPSTAAASPSPALDEAAVATLMGKLQANPKDTTTLMSLADEYYAAGDFTTAESWLVKLLEVDPQHVRGLLALGAVQFNTGRMGEAKASWEKVLAVEPDNLEAHYDLGFYYLNQDPPDMTGVQAEWGKVVEIDPTSEIAQTVKAHLDALASPAPSGSVAPGGSGAPSGSPAASPEASPAASPAASAAPSASPAASESVQP